ncbi:hypothetical protein V6Z93_000946 [Aspergillus fumigatus]
MRWPCCGTAPLIMALFERKEAHSGQRFRSDPQRLEKSYLTNRSFSEPWVFQPIRLIGVQAMSKKSSWVKKRHSDSARAKAQQRHRRKRNLLKKAAEFSLECESDVFLAVRIQTTGQIHIFDSSSETQWLNILSNMAMCYPTPIHETLEDIFPQPEESRSSGLLGSASTGDEETRHELERSSNVPCLPSRQLIEELE